MHYHSGIFHLFCQDHIALVALPDTRNKQREFYIEWLDTLGAIDRKHRLTAQIEREERRKADFIHYRQRTAALRGERLL
jgi:hypothetical protein